MLKKQNTTLPKSLIRNLTMPGIEYRFLYAPIIIMVLFLLLSGVQTQLIE